MNDYSSSPLLATVTADLFITVPETTLPNGIVVPSFMVGQYACTKSPENQAASPLVLIEVRSVYGNDLIYPANDAANALARIAGKKTLSVQNIKDACALGLEVVEVNRKYAAIANLIAA